MLTNQYIVASPPPDCHGEGDLGGEEKSLSAYLQKGILAMTNRQFFLFLFIAVLIVPAPSFAQGGDCGLEPRLEIGDIAYLTPGIPNNVRSKPDTSTDNRVGAIESSASFTVIDGPVCAEGFTWWEVERGDVRGWTVVSDSSDYFVLPVRGEMIASEGVSFILPESIASSAEVSQIAATDSFPAYTEITFEDYADENYGARDTPRIRIFASDAFDGIESQAAFGANVIDALPDLIEDRPDLGNYDIFDNPLPEFSPGAGFIMLAQKQYIDFLNGRGYRFIAAYAQNFVTTDNMLMEYRYQGLTDDGQFFVDASLFIDAPSLYEDYNPDPSASDEQEAFEAYTDASSDFFDGLAPEAFTPSLIDLDLLLTSLAVEDTP